MIRIRIRVHIMPAPIHLSIGAKLYSYDISFVQFQIRACFNSFESFLGCTLFDSTNFGEVFGPHQPSWCS